MISWDKFGNKIWEYEPVEGLDFMADCYAMNIDDKDAIWFYYYTDFRVVQLSQSGKVSVWDCKLTGSSSLNVEYNNLLMAGGYDEDNFVWMEVLWNKIINKSNI